MQEIVQVGPLIKKLNASKVCNLGNSRFAACISPSPSHSI